MNIQIIEHNGAPEYAVVPYHDLHALLARVEDLEDICEAKAASAAIASGAETFPAEFVERFAAGEHPLKIWREYSLTLAELGRMCGVSAAARSQIEKGKRSPSVDLLRKLAHALNCDMDDLLES